MNKRKYMSCIVVCEIRRSLFPELLPSVLRCPNVFCLYTSKFTYVDTFLKRHPHNIYICTYVEQVS